MDFRVIALLLLVCSFSCTEGRPKCNGKGCLFYGGGYVGMGSYYGGGGGGLGSYYGGGGMGSYYGIGGSGTGGAGIGIGINGIGIGTGGAGIGGPGIGNQFISGGYVGGYPAGGYGGGFGGGYAGGYGGGYGYGGGMSMVMGMGGMFPYRGWHFFPFPGGCPAPSFVVFQINKKWWLCRIWFPKKRRGHY